MVSTLALPHRTENSFGVISVPDVSPAFCCEEVLSHSQPRQTDMVVQPTLSTAHTMIIEDLRRAVSKPDVFSLPQWAWLPGVCPGLGLASPLLS